MPLFKDDQIFIIAPGSQTTLAQLGLPESFTPARYRLRSCMFPAEKAGEFEPIKIRKKQKTVRSESQRNGDATSAEQPDVTAEEPDWEEDRLSEEDWPAFYALMDHVYKTVNPPFHTPILLIAEPIWTAKEHENVTQFFFEKFKTPAFSMVDSAMATTYAYGIPSATVIDIGHTKADITCVADFLLHDSSRSAAVTGCGGDAMTQRLVDLLSVKTGFNRQICDQLKRSNICEILPTDEELPSNTTMEESNPAAAASTGMDPATENKGSTAATGAVPRGPGPGTEVGEENKLEDEEGVLDIASIVTGGNMSEYLAQKEREKAEKVAAKQQKKAGDAQANAAAKIVRLPNSRRLKNTFIYEDLTLRDAMNTAGVGSQMAEMASALDNSDAPAETAEDGMAFDVSSADIGAFRREVEVGTERFLAASGGILDRLADAIFRTVQSCSDINKRSDLWDNLIIVGNGSKVRGFKEALLSRISAKYLISPSSATIFTSELPSNLSTPIATGANTPQPQMPGQLHHSSSVNPLLIAATTAQNPHLAPPGSMMHHAHSHTSHGQTPTSIKLAKIPEYFPEWKDVGYDEATFLGAQVAAKVLFITDGGQSNGYMMRTHYNEVGPGGIHEVYL